MVDSSPLDPRGYDAFTLPSNSLRVLLVSDPTLSIGGAAMDVAVGHFSDPAEFPGLAHFLEHMLFLGTEKFPDEGSYRAFLASNGGSSNAYTSTENTNFYFDVAAHAFRDALDRFAQFFISPRMDDSATQREMKAVDSEHRKNEQSDMHRLYQLSKTLADPAHPYSKFGTGSRNTLEKDGIRNALLQFHKTWYSANLMSLVLVGPQPVSELKQWVEQLFTSVENRNVNLPSSHYPGVAGLPNAWTDPYPHAMGQRVWAVPIKDVRAMELSWVTPPFHPEFKTKPSHLVSHLLGHEGKGSLLSLLKAKGWADSLSAGPGKSTDTFGTFDVSIDLTSEAIGSEDQIADLVFVYLRMAREKCIEQWVFDEVAATAAMAFRFQERESAQTLATRISSEMRITPAQYYLSAPYLFFEYDPDGIRKLFDLLTPDRVRLTHVAKEYASKANMEEKWYGTAYMEEAIPVDLLKIWAGSTAHPDLFPPPRNLFIPTDFELVDPEACSEKEGFPALIRSDDRVDLYYLKDQTFRRPKTAINLEFNSPEAYFSPRHGVMTNLYTALVSDELNEFSYDADIAGLHYSLSNVPCGLRLSVTGYSHKLGHLLEAITEKMGKFKVNPDRFDFIRDATMREFQNFVKDQPYQHAMYTSVFAAETPRWHLQQYEHEIQSVSIAEIEQFVPLLLRRMHVDAFVHGNIRDSDAMKLIASALENIGSGPLPKCERFLRRTIQAPTGPNGTVFSQLGPNQDDKNSAINIVFQFGPLSLKASATLEILVEALQKPFFHELRTVQQLGYIVHSGVSISQNVLGIEFLIQSTVAQPADIDRRVEEFLVAFRDETLEQLTMEDLKQYVDGLVARKLELEKKMSQRTSRYWGEISRGRFLFDKRNLDAEVLATIEIADVKQLFDHRVARNGKERRKVASFVSGPGEVDSAEDAAPIDKNHFGSAVVLFSPDDTVAFKRDNALYQAGYSHLTNE